MSVDGEQSTAASEDRSGLPQTIRQRIMLAWASLSVERFWPLLWPAGGIVGLFLILALANLFAYLPEWLHLLSLMGLIAAVVWAVMYSMRQTSMPTRAQAVRHLEQSSGLDHRPLSTLEDHPAVGDEDTKFLWEAHRRWVMKHIDRLKVAWPRLSLAARDPHAIRVLIVLVIVALTVANWSEVPQRLAAAVSPGWAQGNVPASFEAWVTPPAYTGEAPRHLTANTALGQTDDIPVPKGSSLTVRTHGDASASIRVGSLGGSVPRQMRPEFLPAGGDARDAKLAIDTDLTVRLSLNASQAAQWRFKITNDTPPKIGFKTPLAVTTAASLRFNYVVKDDYGVTSARAQIVLDHASSPSNRKAPAPIVFDLPLPPAPARDGEATVFKDLTAHVWAGLPVTVTLIARDENGQTGMTKPVKIVLPERQFKEPLARALIEQRRMLARDASSAPFVAKALDALTIAPERFIPDERIFLALRTAYYMISRERSGDDVTSAQQLLWDLALRIEEGDTPQAQAELRAIQQKLMDALARGAPDHEIEQLMAQLRAAIDRALKAMAEKAQGQPNMPGANGQVIRPQDLKSMLDQIQNLSRQGSRAAAQQMLSQLQNMLENMQAMGQGQMSPEQKSATDALEKLGSMIARQRALMDKTFRENQANNDEGRPNKPSALKNDQAKLSDELTAIIKGAKQGSEDTARALTRAQDAMDQATDELGSGKLGNAGEAQQRAIDELRKGGEAIAKQLIQQMQAQGAAGTGQGVGSGESEDPFGRPQASYGPSFGGSVKVPDKLDIQKAREILEELQRRAGERGRPVNELEYIDRLLRRF